MEWLGKHRREVTRVIAYGYALLLAVVALATRDLETVAALVMLPILLALTGLRVALTAHEARHQWRRLRPIEPEDRQWRRRERERRRREREQRRPARS